MYFHPTSSVQPEYLGPPSAFEQNIDYRKHLKSRLPEYVERQLRDRFPIAQVVVHAVLLIAISLAQIGMQIYMIVVETRYFYIGQGIWGGVVGIILGVSALLLFAVRKYNYFAATIILHLVGMLIIFAAFVLVNGLVLAIFDFCSEYTDLLGMLLSASPSAAARNPCQKAHLKTFNIAQLVLGCVSVLLCLIYIINMVFGFAGGCSRGRPLGNPTVVKIDQSEIQRKYKKNKSNLRKDDEPAPANKDRVVF